MDSGNWRPSQGGRVDPSAMAAATATEEHNNAADWRSHLQPEARQRIVANIMRILKKHLPVSVPEGLSLLQKIAVRIEEKSYAAADNQPDYLRKISLKMLSMEAAAQRTSPINPSMEMASLANLSSMDGDHSIGGTELTNHRHQHQCLPPLTSAATAMELINHQHQSLPPLTSAATAMDGGKWRPSQGGPDPSAVVAAAGGMEHNNAADWRSHIRPEGRQRIVARILETLKEHLPITVPEALSELQQIAVRFEEKIYAAANSQPDYLRKLSLKLLSMETEARQTSPINPSLRMASIANPSSMECASLNAGRWRVVAPARAEQHRLEGRWLRLGGRLPASSGASWGGASMAVQGDPGTMRGNRRRRRG